MAQSDRQAADSLGATGVSYLHAVETAILQTVAYSDIFDYPLTAVEIHRYLVGIRASWRTVQGRLEGPKPASGKLVARSGYFLMPGRDDTVETRRRRAAVAAEMWPRARHYGGIIGHLPFVRMVAVTGALAMDNVEPETDIDYLVVTEPGRVWLCRALVVGLVKLARRNRDIICPNYFLSEKALDLGNPNLFTAHELAQMVPLVGLENYRRMCVLNSWATSFLPNAFDAPRSVSYPDENAVVTPGSGYTNGRARPLLWTAAEIALSSPLGGGLEWWEMSRKARKLALQAGVPGPESRGHGAEISFSTDRCKGHFDSHRQRTMEAYCQRLGKLAVEFPSAAQAGTAIRGLA